MSIQVDGKALGGRTLPSAVSSPFFAFSRRQGAATGGYRRHFLISLLVIGSVILGSAVAAQLVPRGPRAALEGARAIQDYYALEREYTRLVEADLYNLDNHRGLLDAHLSIPKEIHARHSTIVRDDMQIQNRYNGYIQSADTRLREIGPYGMGYFCARQLQADRALGKCLT